MKTAQAYVLGQTERGARRLEIQDAHLGAQSEQLLDALGLRGQQRVVEMGCGPGGLSRRIMRRLGAGGVLVGVDSSATLLAQAAASLGGGPARFEPVSADIAGLGTWLTGADVVVGRAVLHHVPMVECMLGRLRSVLHPGTRVGWIEPDFRSPLGRIGYLEATGRPELAPLRVWGIAINQLYQLKRLSPDVGATLAQALQTAGYRNVRSAWVEGRSDEMMVENMLMFYDEVRDRLAELNILSVADVEEQQRLLRALPTTTLPPVWGTFSVHAEV